MDVSDSILKSDEEKMSGQIEIPYVDLENAVKILKIQSHDSFMRFNGFA